MKKVLWSIAMGLSGKSDQGDAEEETLKNRPLKPQNVTPGLFVKLLKFALSLINSCCALL